MPAKKSNDPAELFNEAMKAMPVDMDALKEQMKSSAALGEELAKIALDAAERSNQISSAWTKETLANVGSVSKIQDSPSDLTQAMTNFASAQGELASKNMSAFAEIAKTVQAQTIETLMNASKNMGEEAAAAMAKAQEQLMNISKSGK